MDDYDTALVLSRVLTSGVVMSIEKSDRELPGLERSLTRASGRRHACLVNSRSAAIHAALTGLGIGHGDATGGAGLGPPERSFLAWLGVTADDDVPPPFALLTHADDLSDVDAVALVVDLTGLGFGPAAAFLTDDAGAHARAERLKIFGSYDLRTMWTQEESGAEVVPGVQFNYRLSPLVAACARLALTKGARS
ncbi:hypothetical protein Afil01_44550 [Actinorhabdospora filicis]|uniref:DegT/DnrJ/EryC1/StrS aminotransferase n=1 Tax=Actinorhabdospora filicis TaxID=1785913 RepID=A0A9W6SPB6_9ACTN|nr:degT/DnrJ/EryC1/StrS aminotransferase [Actinorhabdospora filicis]GLZ79648.1 hypothetical protein Afil01_44550 [Actinorhabdospora filicis]